MSNIVYVIRIGNELAKIVRTGTLMSQSDFSIKTNLRHSNR